MSIISELLDSLPQIGRVEWIGVNPFRREPMTAVDEVAARVTSGLEGDHHAKHGPSKRQVTLIQFEHLAVVASILELDHVGAELLRRNVAVRGINLLALKDRRFKVGEAILEGTGTCEPCSRMEEVLGPGGFNALRGHGGITARVLAEGVISIGDAVRILAE
jgi:MOSC domain-containing protein YiiM